MYVHCIPKEMRWEDTKEILTELEAALASYDGDVDNLLYMKALGEKIKAAAAAKEDKTPELPSLRNRKVELQDALLSLRDGIAKVTDERDAVEQRTMMEIPIVKHRVSLYASISNIKWDFSSDTVRGAVLPPQGTPKPFDFDPAKMSDFDLTNALWDVVEEAHSS